MEIQNKLLCEKVIEKYRQEFELKKLSIELEQKKIQYKHEELLYKEELERKKNENDYNIKICELK